MASRVVVLPFAGLAAIASARFITEVLGPQPFAVYSLVAGLPLLVPFADFGIGAALTNAASVARHAPNAFRKSLRRSLLAATGIAALLVLTVTTIGLAGAWPSLVGVEDSTLNWPIAIALSVFALSIPAGLGTSILLGLGRYSLSVIIQGLTPLASFLAVILTLLFVPQIGVLVALSTAGAFAVNLTLLVIALRTVKRLDLVGSDSVVVSFRIFTTAAPMMLLMAAGAVQLQSGRLVLSHSADLQAVGVYASLWLFFQPLFSVVQTAGRAIWPRFARARVNVADSRSDFVKATAINSTIGGVAGVLLAALGPIGAAVATAGAYPVTFVQSATLGAVLLCQGAFVAAGMVLTNPKGLTLQAIATACSAASTLMIGLSIAPILGATGPMLALLVSVLFFQALPISTVAWVTLRRVARVSNG